MAKDLCESFPQAKEKFETASEILDFDLAKLCFEGPKEKLKQTFITQPAIFVHSCIVLDLIGERGLRPDMVAGHSLGEYSALVAAGALEFEAALRLVKVRSQAMQRAGEEQPGTMAALLGLSPGAAAEICERASSAGIVTPANFNAPGQIVISGEENAVLKAIEYAKEAGARKAVQLDVGGAFHSPLMQNALERLKQALDDTAFSDARIPIFQNFTATGETNNQRIKANLDAQLTSPVRWVECVEGMIKAGANEFFEPGPGKILSGLLRRIDRGVKSFNFDKANDLEHLA